MPALSYFNAMVKRGAVGTFYPLAVRLVGQVVFGPELPKFGATGTFGIQGVGSDVVGTMLAQTSTYQGAPGQIHNLDGSQFIKQMEGASGAHSDIGGLRVAHATWQAALVLEVGHE
jgi:hypothetical protein